MELFRRPVVALLFAAALIDPIAAAQADEAAAESRKRTDAVHAAVGRGLEYLALGQNPGGYWLGDVGHKSLAGYAIDFSRARQEAEERGNVGTTALAALAFLAAGHVPGRGPHGKALDRALDYLISRGSDQKPTGYISDSGTRMYEHAFATLCLAQALGMTSPRSRALPERLTAAVGLIVDCQTQAGGWRYLPTSKDCDLSVTVCQLQALRAAKDAGILVSRSCIDRAVDYVKKSQARTDPGRGSFSYQLDDDGSRSKTSFCIDAAAVTSLQSAGLYGEELFGLALDAMDRQYDALNRDYPTHYFFYYGNYYAAQAFHQSGGERGARYAKRLVDDLLARQQKDGRWINDVGPGDEFGTAMACLILSVPDGVLPIFQK